MFRVVLRAAAAATLVACALEPLTVVAQAWPTKPVKFVVPFPPGGSVDPLARILGARLADSLGQQFIVENKTGAGGSIGTAFVARSAPDGYTYVVVFDTHAVNPALIPNLPYDTVNDFAPVMLVGTAPMAIVANVAKPYRSFGDVIQAAKAKPEALSIGAQCTMDGVQFALGKRGRVTIGDFCYFTNAVFLCELEVAVGSRVMIGWNATITDTDFHPIAPAERRE